MDFPMEEFMATTPYDVTNTAHSVEQEVQKGGDEYAEANYQGAIEDFNYNQKAIYGIQQKA